jgi:glucose/arabinose dehydrogenase
LRYVPNENGKSSLEPFVEGFLDEKKNVLGRPVGLLELRDGSLLISDDQNGAVYRVRYVR